MLGCNPRRAELRRWAGGRYPPIVTKRFLRVRKPSGRPSTIDHVRVASVRPVRRVLDNRGWPGVKQGRARDGDAATEWLSTAWRSASSVLRAMSSLKGSYWSSHKTDPARVVCGVRQLRHTVAAAQAGVGPHEPHRRRVVRCVRRRTPSALASCSPEEGQLGRSLRWVTQGPRRPRRRRCLGEMSTRSGHRPACGRPQPRQVLPPAPSGWVFDHLPTRSHETQGAGLLPARLHVGASHGRRHRSAPRPSFGRGPVPAMPLHDPRGSCQQVFGRRVSRGGRIGERDLGEQLDSSEPAAHNHHVLPGT